MNIQSISVCVPAKRCINDCKFCCSKMHAADYEDRFTKLNTYDDYIKDMRKRLEYARQNGCNTCMLTGNNEPQQNKEFLRTFAEINRSLSAPFLNIEMQTSGAYIDDGMLNFLKNTVGVTTIAISVACISNPEKNIELIQTPDKDLNISKLAESIKAKNMNLRICLNMNDHMLDGCDSMEDPEEAVKDIVSRCKYLNADQITCRALWTSEDGTSQAEWINQNVTSLTHDVIKEFKKQVKEDGKYLDTLEYGADRYDFKGFSTVIDEDSMAQSQEKKDSVKYLILRPNGKLYSKWDSKASLIF